jgi:hypothetical protein
MLIRITEDRIYNTETGTILAMRNGDLDTNSDSDIDGALLDGEEAAQAWAKLCLVAEAQDVTTPACHNCGKRPAPHTAVHTNLHYCEGCYFAE